MQSTRLCTVDGCSASVRCLSLCESHYKKSRYTPTTSARVCAECDESFVARNARRAICYEAECARKLRNRKARDQAWSQKYRQRHGRPPGTVAADRRRDALLRGATVGERFTNLQVFERDHWVCGICGGGVDSGLKYPDPMSPSLDHVVPISKGGAHSFSNVQCSHLICNVKLGAAV